MASHPVKDNEPFLFFKMGFTLTLLTAVCVGFGTILNYMPEILSFGDQAISYIGGLIT